MNEHYPAPVVPAPSSSEQDRQPVCFGLAALDEEARREYWAALALRCTPRLGLLSVCALLDRFGSAWEAVQNPHDWDEAGVGPDKVRSFLSEEWRIAARPEWEAARHFRGHIILWTDKRYPQRLKTLTDAPPLLYALGDISLLDAPSVAIVGSRKASQAAMDFVSAVAEELSESGITVISGMAFGIDARAHRSALRGTGRTIAVLAGGADVPYPAFHTELHGKIAGHGLVVSECAPGAPVHAKSFPRRNRIVSGLALGVLMAEAESEKSGSLITARLAADQGRPVYVPSPDALRGEYREGTRSLLMQGAMPIWRAGDLMADLFPHLKHALQSLNAQTAQTAAPEQDEKKETPLPEVPAPERPASSALPPSASQPAPPQRPAEPAAPARRPPALSADENTLCALLHVQPLSADDLLLAAQDKDSSWTAPRLLSTLTIMEVKKLVRRLSDSRYEACL